jgi:hypothetical protein
VTSGDQLRTVSSLGKRQSLVRSCGLLSVRFAALVLHTESAWVQCLSIGMHGSREAQMSSLDSKRTGEVILSSERWLSI